MVKRTIVHWVGLYTQSGLIRNTVESQLVLFSQVFKLVLFLKCFLFFPESIEIKGFEKGKLLFYFKKLALKSFPKIG